MHSLSKKDKTHPVFSLAAWAGKMSYLFFIQIDTSYIVLLSLKIICLAVSSAKESKNSWSLHPETGETMIGAKVFFYSLRQYFPHYYYNNCYYKYNYYCYYYYHCYCCGCIIHLTVWFKKNFIIIIIIKKSNPLLSKPVWWV